MFTVTVGEKSTAATSYVKSPGDVEDVLKHLARLSSVRCPCRQHMHAIPRDVALFITWFSGGCDFQTTLWSHPVLVPVCGLCGLALCTLYFCLFVVVRPCYCLVW